MANHAPPAPLVRRRSDVDLTFNGRFHIQRELNRGATAVVYEAMDMQISRKVALKVLFTHFEGHQCNVAHDLAEAEREVAHSFTVSQHPNICSLLEVFYSCPAKEKLVMVWELVEGVDLLDLLNSCGGRISEQRARRYMRQLISGVKYIHSNGLTHRDIKPENCMVERRTDRLKIIDFGMAKHLASARTLMVGTPDYMAPELLTANMKSPKEKVRGHYDGTAVDVWSMGAVLYIMVTGVFPFESPSHENNLTMTLQNLKHGNYRRLPADASPELVDLIARTFKADPGQRITLAGLASHPWLTDFEEHKVLPSSLSGNTPGGIFASVPPSAPAANAKPTTPPESPPPPPQSKRAKGGGSALAQQMGAMRIAEDEPAEAAAAGPATNFPWLKGLFKS